MGPALYEMDRMTKRDKLREAVKKGVPGAWQKYYAFYRQDPKFVFWVS